VFQFSYRFYFFFNFSSFKSNTDPDANFDAVSSNWGDVPTFAAGSTRETCNTVFQFLLNLWWMPNMCDSVATSSFLVDKNQHQINCFSSGFWIYTLNHSNYQRTNYEYKVCNTWFCLVFSISIVLLVTCWCRAKKLHQLWMPHSLQTSRRFLEVKTVSASTTCDGSEFQCDTTLLQKKCFRMSSRDLYFLSLYLCHLVP